jgi:hypothetical protein
MSKEKEQGTPPFRQPAWYLIIGTSREVTDAIMSLGTYRQKFPLPLGFQV